MRRFLHRVIGGEGSAGPVEDPNRTEDVVHVKHGTKDHEFKFPRGAISSGNVTVGALRAKASQATGVDPSRISLVGLGRSLKDDVATLKSLGIGSGARILCMASQTKASSSKQPAQGKGASPKPPAQAPKPKPAVILSPIEKIEGVRQAVEEKTGALSREFIANPPANSPAREDAHRKISETIMGELLKLDSIESDDPAVRMRRKEVVREIQQKLERLDESLKSVRLGAL
ncbi:hypothetical protein DFH27DRAFT_46329 [Peziza echinospora]|nr:hypothetical protein DFH27DRAFT_46329 [Peziza echinospora]